MKLLAKTAEDRPSSAEEVYHRLVPFANELTTLPGVLTPPSVPSPVRIYASVVGRVLADSAVDVRPPQPEHAPFSRSDVLRARAEARSLARSSQYERAADVLAAAAQQATRVLGTADPDLLSLRFELANLLFDGGEYARGAQEFGALAADLARHDGPDDSVARQCRRQEATCNAMLGRVDEALAQLRALLVDESRWLGPDHDGVFELRKQIGLLELGGHRPEQARNTLEALLRDLERVGNQNAVAAEVRTLIEGLSK